MSVQEDVLDLIFGRWRSQTLHAGTKLGVFECVNKEPKLATEIAAELALDPALAYRLNAGARRAWTAARRCRAYILDNGNRRVIARGPSTIFACDDAA